MAETYDLIVIGAGPGGYVAALRAAQLGMKVACIEKRPMLGGTCLNVGCIPSKALLESSHKLVGAREGLAAHGVIASDIGFNLATMQARKDKVVADLTNGIAYLFKKNKVTWLKGAASLVNTGEVAIAAGSGESQVAKARSILIATGSEPVALPMAPFDEDRIVSSTGALAFADVPRRLAVVGAGYIGLELGSVWRRLGAEVTVIEALERITPGMDVELSKHLQRALTKQGLAFRLGVKLEGMAKSKTGVTLTLMAERKPETLEVDRVLVSVGRRPATKGLGLTEAGVRLDARGFVEIDADFRTSLAGVYAIGDCVRGPMLAHKAMDEGVTVAELMAGQRPSVNYDAIPSVIYTWPEAAAVGKTEEELKTAGIKYRVGKFAFTANSRARTQGESEGFVKLLADDATDRLLGAHILGPEAGTLIHELVVAMEFGGSVEDIARTCHAHPTLAEAVKEAALAALGHALHS